LPKPRGKLILVALLFISAAAILGNSQKYQSETHFWASALKSSPNNSFFLNKYAGQLRKDGDFVGSEILLRRALTFSMKNSTAVAIALQLAASACDQARYGESLDWLEKIRSLPLDFLQAKLRLLQLLKIYQARGDLPEAEKVIRVMTHTLHTAEIKTMSIELYLTFAEWAKARETAAAFKMPDAGDWPTQIGQIQAAFQAMTPRGQAIYFINHGNFAYSWRLWPKSDLADVAEQLQTARLAFLAGHEEEGMNRIESLSRKAGSDFRLLNSLGSLFFDLQRADQALPFFQRSLHVNPKQPALLERIRLTDRRIVSARLK